MKKNVFVYATFVVAIFALALVMLSLVSHQAKQIHELKTEITDLKNMNSYKGDSIKILKDALQATLQSHCDTMTVEQRLKFLEFQKYEVKMWTEKEKAEMAAYRNKEKLDMAAYRNKENGTTKNWMVFDKTKYHSLKELSEQHPKEFVQYVIAEFWKDNSSGESSYKHWEEFEKIEKISGVKEHVALEKSAYRTYEAANKKLEAEYSEVTKKNEQSYQNQLKELRKKYNELINQKKADLGL